MNARHRHNVYVVTVATGARHSRANAINIVFSQPVAEFQQKLSLSAVASEEISTMW